MPGDPHAPADLLGAHVSTAGGTAAAPIRAKAIAATAMQIFTKQAQRWAERSCATPERRQFRAALRQTQVRAMSAHDSYLINLASPDKTLRTRSLESFICELTRCKALGLHFLVTHPGNYIDDRPSGLARNIDGITAGLEAVPGRTKLLLETMAGSGTALGSTFEELGALIEALPARLRRRVGVCVDTCHVYSAGYDLVSDYEGVWARFDDCIGLERLRMMHLNDSKTPLASSRDRHELIGEGSLGDEPFRRIMRDERFTSVPKVIETPKLGDAEATDRRMLERLRGYVTR